MNLYTKLLNAYKDGSSILDVQFRLKYTRDPSVQEKLSTKLTYLQEKKYGRLEKLAFKIGHKIADIQIKDLEKRIEKSRR